MRVYVYACARVSVRTVSICVNIHRLNQYTSIFLGLCTHYHFTSCPTRVNVIELVYLRYRNVQNGCKLMNNEKQIIEDIPPYNTAQYIQQP